MNKSLRKAISILLILALLLPAGIAAAEEPTPAPEVTLASAAPTVTARSAIVIDFETGEPLFTKDPDTRRPPASMTKIMTAFLVYEEIAAGRLSLDSTVRISNHAANFAPNNWPAHIRIPAGSDQSVETLLRLIMLPSHNGACIAVAEHIAGSEAAFVRRMNETANRLGISASYENAHGLWGNTMTARAAATLTQTFIRTHPDILRITSTRSWTFNGTPISNTNSNLFDPRIDGFKTGTTAAAGWNLSATATQDGRRIIVITMHSSSNANRYSDSMRLTDFGLAELSRRANLQPITIDLSTAASTARRNSYTRVTAQLTDVGGWNFPTLGGNWTVNGREVSTFGPFVPTSQRTLTFSHFLPADSDLYPLNIGFHLNLPGGQSRNASLLLPVSDAPPALFRDMHGHWSYANVTRAVELGIFSQAGVGGGRFDPGGSMTRGMFVTALGRLARDMGFDVSSGSPASPFGDVAPGRFYSPYVAWAAERGIVQGVATGRFAPANPVTRQEAATLLYHFMRAYGIQLPRPPVEPAFSDADQISTWALEAVRMAFQANLITGHPDGRFAPRDTATRAEVATIFTRFVNAIV